MKKFEDVFNLDKNQQKVTNQVGNCHLDLSNNKMTKSKAIVVVFNDIFEEFLFETRKQQNLHSIVNHIQTQQKLM